jgi:hypothetical protein
VWPKTKKNTFVFQPSPEELDSAAFRVIVGEPKFTRGGHARGTILDVARPGLLEIKGGLSTLDSSYQLRLQVYYSLQRGEPLTIRTTRPMNPEFEAWLRRWGVTIEEP